jgi:hypothetical protein
MAVLPRSRGETDKEGDAMTNVTRRPRLLVRAAGVLAAMGALLSGTGDARAENPGDATPTLQVVGSLNPRNATGTAPRLHEPDDSDGVRMWVGPTEGTGESISLAGSLEEVWPVTSEGAYWQAPSSFADGEPTRRPPTTIGR